MGFPVGASHGRELFVTQSKSKGSRPWGAPTMMTIFLGNPWKAFTGGVVARASHTVLDSFQCFTQGSPWFDLDPGATYACSGPVIGAGAMAWVRNGAIDSGRQKIIESMSDGRIVNVLDCGAARSRPITAR